MPSAVTSTPRVKSGRDVVSTSSEYRPMAWVTSVGSRLRARGGLSPVPARADLYTLKNLWCYSDLYGMIKPCLLSQLSWRVAL